ncbi:MAG: type IV pilus biogenesis/stability protein PilW [Gammaproteobacteria bacterium]
MKSQPFTVLALCATLALVGCSQSPTRSDTSLRNAAKDNVELATYYMREGQRAVALDLLLKAVEQDPDLPVAHNTLAVLYEGLGETDKANRHFRRALSLDPKDSQAHNNYGSFLCKTQGWAAAEGHFLKAAGNPLYETPELAYTNAGTCANSAGHPDKAEEYWRKALSLNPRYPLPLLQMARLGVAQQNYLSARAYLQRLHEVARPTPESLWLGIQTERVLGDKNAEASYSLFLRNNFPDSPQTKLLQGHRPDEPTTGN